MAIALAVIPDSPLPAADHTVEIFRKQAQSLDQRSKLSQYPVVLHRALNNPAQARESVYSIPSLHWAAAEGQREEVQAYLRQGVNPNLTDKLLSMTALHWAAAAGQSGTIRALLDAGANPEPRDARDGRTPLMFAAVEGNLFAALALVDRGANVNAADNDGYTPLHYATTPDITELLRAAGANPNARTADGKTPLMIAAANGNRIVVEGLLVELDGFASADFNLADDDGWTALHFAALSYGSWRSVSLALILSRANLNAFTENGLTPIQVAAWTGNSDLVLMLCSNGVRSEACQQ